MDNLIEFLINGITHASVGSIIAFTLLVTHITIASVTIYLHRCQAHRALDLHPIASHFFRFWLWLTTGQVTKEWAAVHRKHHAKCEREGDPHSPVVFGIKKVLLEGAELYRQEARNTETLERFGHGTPNDWIEKNLYTRHSALGVFIMLGINIILFGSLGLTVWAIQMLWIPITAAGIINGLGHYRGYRNFECEDASTNLMPWGILIGGEELHNNHHTYPTSAKLSNKWWEFDIGWLYIQTLSAIGLAHVKKTAPHARQPKTNTATGALNAGMLSQMIGLRHEIMAEFAKLLKTEARQATPASRKELKLLKIDPAKLNLSQAQSLQRMLTENASIQKMFAMREELRQMWLNKQASKEELLEQMSQWCKRAEECGISNMKKMSLFIRHCAASMGPTTSTTP